MNTGSFSENDNASESDGSEHCFVTKRTFELLEEEEPFLQKQLRIFTSSGNEHLDVWRDNLREIVEPLINEGDTCVDCIKDIISLAWVPHFKGRQRLTVGPPARDLIPPGSNSTSTSKRLSNSNDKQPLSYETKSSIEKRNKWTISMMGQERQGPTQSSTSSPASSRSLEKESDTRINSTKSKMIVQKMIPGRETPGVLRNRLMVPSKEKTVFEKYTEAESRKKKSDEEQRQDEEYKSITCGRVFLVPVSITDSVHEQQRSGNRPESPIKLFSSMDFYSDEFADDESHLEIRDGPEASVEEDLTNQNQSVSTGKPSESDPKPLQYPLEVYPVAEAEQEGSNSFIQEPIRERHENYANDEGRDPLPCARDDRRDNEASVSVSQRREQVSIDSSTLDVLSGDNQFPYRRSLLYSMRIQNRKLDLLAEQLHQFSTRYTFGASGDDLSTDRSATLSSRGSTFFPSTSEYKRGVGLPERSDFLADETSLVFSSDTDMNGDSSIANSSTNTDGDREGSQSSFHEEFIPSRDGATFSVHEPKKELPVRRLYRNRPLLRPRFRSKSVY